MALAETPAAPADPPMRTLTVRALADLHGYLPVVETCDLLLIAGDIAPYAIQSKPQECEWWLEGEFSQWIEDIGAGEVIAVAGNHDLWARDIRPGAHPGLFGVPWTFLHDATVTAACGLTVHGTPWQLPFGYGYAFNLRDSELEEKYALIAEGTDIVISHGPPYGILDEAPRSIHGYQFFEHAGSMALLNALQRVRPQLTVFGHIHPGGGQRRRLDPDDLHSGLLANVAVLGPGNVPVRGAGRFELARPTR